jgi:hypothetical protein
MIPLEYLVAPATTRTCAYCCTPDCRQRPGESANLGELAKRVVPGNITQVAGNPFMQHQEASTLPVKPHIRFRRIGRLGGGEGSAIDGAAATLIARRELVADRHLLGITLVPLLPRSH